jgi:cytosine/uracil/thiamine/allantoin permease
LNTPTIVLVALVPLIAWRIYSRVRRMVGRQRLSRIRPWISVCLFPVLVLLLAFLSLQHSVALAALAGGLLAGSLLAVYGLRLTRFERTAEGLFYTPNAYLGVALSLLLVGRVLYRAIEVYAGGVPSTPDFSQFARSPATLAIFGMLAGYYVAYAVGLLRWRHRD